MRIRILIGTTVVRIASAVRSSLIDNKRAQLNCKILTGIYILQGNRAAFNQYTVDATCKLCLAAPETWQHFIAECSAYTPENVEKLNLMVFPPILWSHTCEPFLMDMREIWFSFQGDWSLHQGDYSTAVLTRRFKLFSVKLERNFKQYMNYSALCFKFTLKLTKISTKYIKTERFQCN